MASVAAQKANAAGANAVMDEPDWLEALAGS